MFNIPLNVSLEIGNGTWLIDVQRQDLHVSLGRYSFMFTNKDYHLWIDGGWNEAVLSRLRGKLKGVETWFNWNQGWLDVWTDRPERLKVEGVAA